MPRFLFRGWHKWSGNRYHEEKWENLNTPDKIDTHYFHEHPNNPIRPLWKISDAQSLINGHLGGSGVVSEFSSWTHDFPTAVEYANYEFISVIDRTQLSRDVKFYHTVDLNKIFGTTIYEEEYLAHGPVEGLGLITVAASDLSIWTSPYASRPALSILDAVRFARSFMTKRKIREFGPLFYFLVATQLGKAWPHYILENNKPTMKEIEELLLSMAHKIQLAIGIQIPPIFAGEFQEKIAMLDSLPTAARPLILLRAMAFFKLGLRRPEVEKIVRADMTRLGMKRKAEDDIEVLTKLMRSNRLRDVQAAKARKIEVKLE